MTHILLNTAVKLFLQTHHPDIMKRWDQPFLRGLPEWVKDQYPGCWSEFQRYTRQTYKAGFRSECLQ